MSALSTKFAPDYAGIETVINLGSCQYEAVIDFNHYPESIGSDRAPETELLQVLIEAADGVWLELPEEHFKLIQDEVEEFVNTFIYDRDSF